MILTRTPFVPSRNSRHRIAAIALYRALIKAARAVPVPSSDPAGSEQQQQQQQQQRQASAHPLGSIVRRRFDRNKRDDSLRLVYASMSAGYKFLTLLANAQTPSSPEHTRVLTILRTQQKKAASSRALAAARPHRPSKRQTRPPLLVNVAAPGERPLYTATPRPKADFTGPRRIPSLASIAEGFPFLRYTKPQPRDLSAMIGKRRTRWIKLADAVRFAEEVSGPQAVLEDQWEYLVSQQLRSEKGSDVERPQDVSETYLWSSTLEKLWAEHKLDITWDDWTARGEGLYSLLKAERALAEKEGDTPRHQLFGSAPTLAETEAILASSGTPQQPANSMNIVESTRHAPTLGTRRAAAKTHGFVEGETHHFFATPVWADIVDGDRVRLLKWMRSTPKWDWKYVSFISTRDRRLLGPENPSGTLGNRQVPRPNSNFKDRRA